MSVQFDIGFGRWNSPLGKAFKRDPHRNPYRYSSCSKNVKQCAQEIKDDGSCCNYIHTTGQVQGDKNKKKKTKLVGTTRLVES